ncbi:hypothetical protein Unana1_06505 [Umbelopsis nana]
MSCQACSGCFTGGGCSTKKTKQHQKGAPTLETLLAKAEAGKVQEAGGHDHLVTAIADMLANNVYSSQMALYAMYDQLPLADFLSIIRKCHEHKVQGPYIAWLWEYAKQNPQTVLELLVKGASQSEMDKLWDYLDDQAELHQAFGGTGVEEKVKRT